MNVKDAIELFCRVQLGANYSENTMDLYRWMLTEMAAYLGNPEVGSITPMDLQSFMYHMRMNYRKRDGKPLSSSSLDNCWKAIRSFFGWAATELEIDRPDTRLARPKVSSKEIDPFTPEEIKALLDACQYTRKASTGSRRAFKMRRPTSRRDIAIFAVLLDTGLRVSEMCRLTIRDVNLAAGEIKVAPYGSRQKTKSRTVMIGKKTVAAITRYLIERGKPDDKEPLFLAKTGAPMDRHSTLQLLRRIGEAAGIQGVHPHRFRHTFAIEFLRRGGDVFSLQKILGHSTMDMVKNYLQLAQADIASAHRRASPGDWLL